MLIRLQYPVFNKGIFIGLIGEVGLGVWLDQSELKIRSVQKNIGTSFRLFLMQLYQCFIVGYDY